MTKRYKSVWDAIEHDPHVAQHLKVRSELLIALQEHLRELKLTQEQIASKLGIHQPRVSDLMCGRIEQFSTDALINYASDAGLHVGLIVQAQHA